MPAIWLRAVRGLFVGDSSRSFVDPLIESASLELARPIEEARFIVKALGRHSLPVAALFVRGLKARWRKLAPFPLCALEPNVLCILSCTKREPSADPLPRIALVTFISPLRRALFWSEEALPFRDASDYRSRADPFPLTSNSLPAVRPRQLVQGPRELRHVLRLRKELPADRQFLISIVVLSGCSWSTPRP